MFTYKLDTMKGMFFDSKKVLSAVDRATRRVLSKFGAYVRTAARSSIRKRKHPAAPGSPPSSHTGLLKRLIFFGYEPGRQSVVIGPTLLGARGDLAPAAGQTVPGILEYGGAVRARRATMIRKGKPGRDAKGRFVDAPRVRIAAGTTITYAARPFMGPALEKEKPKLPALWAGSAK